MSISQLSPDDTRLTRIVALRDRDLRREGLLVAEGRWLATRLLEAGLAETVVLVAPRFANNFAPYAKNGTEVLVASDEILSAVAGFDFHRGAIAIARRPLLAPLETVLANPAPPETIIVLPDTTNAENLGAIFRSAAALGIETFLLGERCCDEFSRRTLRVSMGAALRLTLVKSEALLDDLVTLRRAGYSLAATVLELPANTLATFVPPDKLALLFGSEADGLADEIIKQADHCLTIPMAEGANSLNLAAAAAIALWHVQTARASRPPR
jgi:tRNA G18 (ribose-2'-O)-methylase SpoU